MKDIHSKERQSPAEQPNTRAWQFPALLTIIAVGLILLVLRAIGLF